MYMRAIELDPSRPGRFISIAQVCRELGRIEDAISHTRRALEIEARNVEYLLLLVELCKACDKHEQAREAVTLILEIDPDNKDAGEIY